MKFFMIIQNPSAQILKDFNQYGLAEKTKVYLRLNALIKPNL